VFASHSCGMLECLRQACRVKIKITFELLPTHLFVFTKTNSMKGLVNWIYWDNPFKKNPSLPYAGRRIKFARGKSLDSQNVFLEFSFPNSVLLCHFSFLGAVEWINPLLCLCQKGIYPGSGHSQGVYFPPNRRWSIVRRCKMVPQSWGRRFDSSKNSKNWKSKSTWIWGT